MATPIVNIPEAVRKSFEVFCSLKGRTKDEFTSPFWDLVVLGAQDEPQQRAFELQIDAKLRRGEIPRIPYHVYPDPPGPKAGCGGCTMNVIRLLKEKYGAQLETFRVLLLSCGGQSQRLPCSSILGKLFMALPISHGPPLSLFEYKLFCYLPLMTKMAPGIFHSASDTIEVFDLGTEDTWCMSKPGFTALAHPSSLEIGMTHGVFVLEGENTTSKTAELRKAEMVLQKPPLERMRAEEAILINKDGEEFVYTDSNFFFDHQVANMLLEFYIKEAPLECEIDSYADFMQPLGRKATLDFAKDLRNVSNVEPRLVELREKIFHLLNKTPLNVLTLNASKFYHLGTMKEYIFHFCEHQTIAGEMGFEKQTFCKFTDDESLNSPKKKISKVENKVGGTLIHSILSNKSVLANNVILEFCKFTAAIEIGENCIISSCCCKDEDIVQIPAETFLHTMAVSIPPTGQDKTELVQYVTVAFHLTDDIKKTAPDQEASISLPYFTKTLKEFSKSTGKQDLFSGSKQEKFNLWFAKLFVVCNTMNESFRTTFKILKAIRGDTQHDLSDSVMVSMADILKWKNAKAMINFRQELYDEISCQ